MADLRKTIIQRERILADAYGPPCDPICRVVAMAVVRNPLAGRFEEDLTPLFEIGAEVGARLAEEAIALLDKPPVSYGKGAIVGVGGEMEHGGGLIHPRLGKPMRAVAGGGEAVIPSNVKIGPPGTQLDLPLGHKDNPWSFDHFDTMTVFVPDAPGPGEIVMVVAYADGGRPLPRCGAGPVTS